MQMSLQYQCFLVGNFFQVRPNLAGVGVSKGFGTAKKPALNNCETPDY